jgi:hypothetical protein
VCVCVPIVAVCPMRAALLGVACLRVFVWPLSVSLLWGSGCGTRWRSGRRAIVSAARVRVGAYSTVLLYYW